MCILTQKRAKTVRTDKWQIAPNANQKALLLSTVAEYRRLCRYLVTVISAHWPELGHVEGNSCVGVVEKLVHKTAKNPNPKYPQVGKAFHKFPSYYRRAAINFAFGQVSSYMTRCRLLRDSGDSRFDVSR